MPITITTQLAYMGQANKPITTTDLYKNPIVLFSIRQLLLRVSPAEKLLSFRLCAGKKTIHKARFE